MSTEHLSAEQKQAIRERVDKATESLPHLDYGNIDELAYLASQEIPRLLAALEAAERRWARAREALEHLDDMADSILRGETALHHKALAQFIKTQTDAALTGAEPAASGAEGLRPVTPQEAAEGIDERAEQALDALSKTNKGEDAERPGFKGHHAASGQAAEGGEEHPEGCQCPRAACTVARLPQVDLGEEAREVIEDRTGQCSECQGRGWTVASRPSGPCTQGGNITGRRMYPKTCRACRGSGRAQAPADGAEEG